MFRVGAFLDFVWLTTRTLTPMGRAYVQMSGRHRIGPLPQSGFDKIERLATRKKAYRWPVDWLVHAAGTALHLLVGDGGHESRSAVMKNGVKPMSHSPVRTRSSTSAVDAYAFTVYVAWSSPGCAKMCLGACACACACA